MQGLRSSQRTTLHSRLPPPTLPWAPEIELRSLTLHSKHVLYPLPEAEPSSSYPWRCYSRLTIFGRGIILVVDINMEERGRGQSGRNCRKEDSQSAQDIANMQGTGPHHRPCGCISQARTKQGKYTPGNLADTHCSLELRTGLFSTLYSLSTSCCYREDPIREWKEELEKAKHDTKTGNTGMFNPRSQSAPLRTIPFFLTVNGKTNCKTKPKHRHLSPADLVR